MLCSGCGKGIPFVGDVCPYCQRDKSKDQTYMMLAFIFGPLFALFGFGIFGGWGAVGGFVLGCGIAYFVSGTGRSKPPEITLKSEGRADKNRTPDEHRLMKIKELFDEGLINESEYKEKKWEILGTL